ncbi:hypothetical protein SAMN00017405_1329 [Desulfonispora thiosulfatigenes DSM 11270]|uniref:Uncharacterized protein n=1 Tax=Desulfonispora thiosulfatigenes DSM 11270 TaxID=656914 RepID=A0A1W1VAV1_DESTI|nr:hypothetical protein [Desulfonispora thiosulfatigenes]SMB90549.1 hypothetical protein SAMN00017405_1329 [Desulfonispora thiosulfatigenes DSM 11270]
MIKGENADFNNQIIKIGVIGLSMAIVANFIPALYLWFVHGVCPPIADIFTLWGLAAAAFGVSWVVQPIAYYTILGTAGTYMSWLCGSVIDIRLPAVTMAQKVTNFDANTKEGEVISIIGVTVSIFVSVSMITIFTLIGYKFLPMLPEFIKESFKYILPALFGAVYVEIMKKNFKAGLGTIVVALLLYLASFFKINAAIMTLTIVACGMIVARIVYKLEKREDE